MGNCQTTEVTAVVLHHPGGKIERICMSVSASDVMSSNPGHYVAMLVVSPVMKNDQSVTQARHLKLLRPDDTLLIGQVYRLISFEEVLKEFAAKKCVKVGKLMKERGKIPKRSRVGSDSSSNSEVANDSSIEMEEQEVKVLDLGGSCGGDTRRTYGGGRQWRPALQSIAELGN